MNCALILHMACCCAGYPASLEFLEDWQKGIAVGGNNRTVAMCTLEDVHRDTWRRHALMNTFITRHKAIVYAIYREYYGHATTFSLDTSGDSRPPLNDWPAACRAIDLQAANLAQGSQFKSEADKVSRGSSKAFSQLADALKKSWSASDYEQRYGALLGLTSERWLSRNRIGDNSKANKRRRTAAAVAIAPTQL
jgi:hypothetical protein